MYYLSLCGWNGVYVELVTSSRKEEKKSSPALAPANIFYLFKLKLDELEGRTVKSLCINKSPTRNQTALPLMKHLSIEQHTFKIQTQPSSQCSKEVKGHMENEV